MRKTDYKQLKLATEAENSLYYVPQRQNSTELQNYTTHEIDTQSHNQLFQEPEI